MGENRQNLDSGFRVIAEILRILIIIFCPNWQRLWSPAFKTHNFFRNPVYLPSEIINRHITLLRSTISRTPALLLRKKPLIPWPLPVSKKLPLLRRRQRLQLLFRQLILTVHKLKTFIFFDCHECIGSLSEFIQNELITLSNTRLGDWVWRE